MTSHQKGLLLISLSTLAATVNYLGFEAIFHAYPTLDIVNAMTWGMLGTSALTAPYFLRSKKMMHELTHGIRRHARAFLAVVAMMAVGFSLWLFAIPQIGAGPLTLISKVQTLFAVGLGVAILGERITKNELGGAALALIGIALVSTLGSEVTTLGVLAAFGFAVCQTVMSFIIKRYCPDVHGLAFAYALAGAMAILFGAIGIVTGTLVVPSLTLAAILAGNQIFGLIIGRAFYFEAHNHLPMSALNVYILAGPGVTLVAAWLLFGDPLTLQKIAGAVLITAGLAWFSRARAHAIRAQHISQREAA